MRWLLLLLLCSCKGTKTREQVNEIWDQSKKAVPVVVAVVACHPLGAGIQAAVTVGVVIITDLWDEKASLASGETLSETQLLKELSRARFKVAVAEDAATVASAARDWLYTAVQYALAGLVAGIGTWLHWRNRHNWARLGYWKGVWLHGVFGGSAGTATKQRVLDRLG